MAKTKTVESPKPAAGTNPPTPGGQGQATVTPTTTSPTALAGAQPASSTPTRGPVPGRPAVGLADQLGDTVAGTVRVVHTVLPGRLPAYLGAGALLALGVIDPPIALAGGLVYEALRRWSPQQPQPS